MFSILDLPRRLLDDQGLLKCVDGTSERNTLFHTDFVSISLFHYSINVTIGISLFRCFEGISYSIGCTEQKVFHFFYRLHELRYDLL